MAYCPNCQAELAADAPGCAACNAVFTPDGWRPVANKGDISMPQNPAVSRGNRIASGAAKVIGAVLSLAFVFWGGMWAAQNRSEAWQFAAFGLGLAVIGVALFARARWMLLMMPATFAFGFASCTANFRWG